MNASEKRTTRASVSPAPECPSPPVKGETPPSKSGGQPKPSRRDSPETPSSQEAEPPAEDPLQSPLERLCVPKSPRLDSSTSSADSQTSRSHGDDEDEDEEEGRAPEDGARRAGTVLLARHVLRWANRSTSSVHLEDSTRSITLPASVWRDANRNPIPTAASLFDRTPMGWSSYCAEDSVAEDSPAYGAAKAKRLQKAVRNLKAAKAFLSEKVEGVGHHLVGGEQPPAQSVRARLLETLHSVAMAVQKMDGDDVNETTAVQPPRERHLSIASDEVYPGAGAGLSPPPPGPGSSGQHDFSDPMDSGSPFFHSRGALETSGNRLLETILSLHRAAQTDEELLWLFRHSPLLCLLPRKEQEEAVAASLRREFSRGETILEKGSPIRHLYLVVWGAVDAFQIVPHHGSAPSPSQRHYAYPYSVPAGNSPAKKFVSAAARAVPQSAGHVVRRLSGSMQVDPEDRFGLPVDGKFTLPPSSGSPSSPSTSNRSGVDVKTNTHVYPVGGFRDGVGVHQGTMVPGQVFGVEQCVFDGTSEFCFRASLNYNKTVVVLIPLPVVRSFLQRHTRFAQSVGDAITSAMDVFQPIREFCRSVFSASTDENEYLPLWAIVDLYTRLENVIHTKLLSREVDTGAWGYALNRLPANVTTTFCFNLVHALPPFVASRMRKAAQAADVRQQQSSTVKGDRQSRTAVKFIETKDRRRCTWHLGMDGKTLVLLRDGCTDLLDFLTMLCVHIIESNKLRGRLQGMVHPPAIDVLDAYLQRREDERLDGVHLSAEEEMLHVKDILRSMPLTETEQAGLISLWKADTALRMYEVMMHREEYNVRVDPSLSRKFQINPFHEWALNLRACVLQKIGLKVVDPLPDDLYIDVVSSNTHCIKNLLSSFNRKYKKEILAYAKRCEGARLGPWEAWHNEDDILYTALVGFLQNERPDLKEEYTRSLEQNGITVLNDTAMTGLQVDVIPVHLLHLDTIDQTISESAKSWFRQVFCEGMAESEMDTSMASLSTASPVSGHTRSPAHGPSKSFTGRGAEPPAGSSSPRGHHHEMRHAVNKAGKAIPRWSEMCRPVYDKKEKGSYTGSAEALPGPSFPTPVNSPPASDGAETPIAENYDDANPCSAQAPRARVYRLHRHFIINMDFAFGAQAEGICRAVFSAFGHRIRSVSIMGKAGGMKGKRGDIQLASHVLMSKSSFIIEDNQDELRNCRNEDLTKERLEELAGPRVNVFTGNVLTVTGTMLQNVKLLRYYQRVWGCVGMEMEGSYFARVIEDFHQQGITRPDMISRFAYYTSDLPLAASDAEEAGDGGDSETLSAPMTPLEGVPPLYAIARGILERIVLP